MKAPVAQQRTLLELQTVDTRASRIAGLLRSLPEDAEAAALAERTAAARRVLALIESERDDAEREMARIEEDAAVVRARMVRDRERRDASSSAKEVQGFESEIVALTRRLGDLDDMELGVMERAEEISARLDAARAEYADLEQQRAGAAERATAQRSELSAEQLLIREDRERLASGIGPELLALYDRQRERYGVGAALLRGGVSQGSGVELHESDLAKIRAADPEEVILDPDGGCILVRTEESGL